MRLPTIVGRIPCLWVKCQVYFGQRRIMSCPKENVATEIFGISVLFRVNFSSDLFPSSAFSISFRTSWSIACRITHQHSLSYNGMWRNTNCHCHTLRAHCKWVSPSQLLYEAIAVKQVYTDSMSVSSRTHTHMRTHVYTYVYTISILGIACLEEIHND